MVRAKFSWYVGLASTAKLCYSNGVIKIVHLSDWHETPDFLKPVEYHSDADFVIATGDMVANSIHWNRGNLYAEREIQRSWWLGIREYISLCWPNATIVAVPGNHDYCDYGTKKYVFSIDGKRTESFAVKGVRFTGFRGVPYFRGQWNSELDARELAFRVSKLDPNADVLLTHTPPYQIMDVTGGLVYAGSMALREWVDNKWQGKLHCFGHIHECGGKVSRNDKGQQFSNASCTMNYLEIDL
jgi:Icc-related predicted phosphoesterase